MFFDGECAYSIDILNSFPPSEMYNDIKIDEISFV